jgi:hypothetical protein
LEKDIVNQIVGKAVDRIEEQVIGKIVGSRWFKTG